MLQPKQTATGKVMVVPRSNPLKGKHYDKIYSELTMLGVKKPSGLSASVEPRDATTGGFLRSSTSLLERKTVCQVSNYK